MRKSVLFIFVFGVCFCTTLLAQSTQKEKDILTFLDINGGRAASELMLNQVFTAFKKMKPDVPATFWEQARKDFTVDGLHQELLPLYEDLFTHEEIKELIAFYQTDTGKKMASLTNEIARRSMAAGEVFGRNLAENLMKKIEEAGY
ncbi:MAG: DUF2059 domain-containing protein [Luteibaculaceae bacterium]